MIRPERFDPQTPIAEPSIEPTNQKSKSWGERWRNLLRRSGWITPVALGALAVLLLVIFWRTLQSDTEPPPPVDIGETVSEILASATQEPVISALVYQAVFPSLVIIQTENDNAADEENGFAIGSGIVINNDAQVLTALHVVEGASAIRITFTDGTVSLATIATADPENDIAVLTPAALPGLILPGTIGNTAALRVGDEVFTVGNPLGLAGSLSAGVVSGLGRDFQPSGKEQTLQGLIQFDAAVNPGSSGGPLLDRRGQVVGIVTGLTNPTEQEVFIGIGFAVPIEEAASAAGGPDW